MKKTLLIIFIFAACVIKAQNVGINTTTPTANFDINGTFRLRNGAAAGRILTSDAKGNATWTTPPSTTRSDVFSIGSASFVAQSDANPVFRSSGQGGAYFSSVVTQGLVAPVNLPNGAVITEITFWFRDNSSNDLNLIFGYEGLNYGGFSFLASTTTSGVSTDWRSVTVTPSTPIIINNNTAAYYIEAYGSWPGTYDLAIKGVTIKYSYVSSN